MVYYPHLDNIVAYRIGVVMDIIYAFFFLIALMCFDKEVKFFLGFILAVMLFNTKNAYMTSKIKVIFHENCLEVFDKKNNIIYENEYKNIEYAFYGTGYKGKECILLSTKELNKKSVDDICFQSHFFHTPIVEECIVIPINKYGANAKKERELLEQWIHSKIKSIRKI